MSNNLRDHYRYGSLPSVAPLALAYVPMQDSAEPAYEPAEALTHGTLFPGLDLPFMNVVNGDLPDTPRHELMAICFVCDELTLYLDTHPEDSEAFAMLQTFLALKAEARERYVRRCGALDHGDLLGMNEYTWLKAPWPWEYGSKSEV